MEINLAFITNWLATTLRLSAPLILVGIGGVYSERVGIFNIGMEGMMLAGALAAVAGSYFTGSLIVATLWAMAAGGILGVLHAYLTVSRRANQIVSGAAINFLALGATNMLYARLFRTVRSRVALYPIPVPESWQSIPFLGPILFSQSLIVWIALLLPFLGAWALYRTSWGLNIRAVGEYPHAVATAGLSVLRLKYTGVIISGIFAGLGGAALVLSELGYFAPGITAGRGFIVLAALVVGRWNPILVAAACLLFGAADGLQLWFQTFKSAIPYQFPLMVPYLLTILALAGLVGRVSGPKTVGKSYNPENI